MITFDLGLAWNWEFDCGFVRLLESECQRMETSFLQITPQNLLSVIQQIQSEKLKIRAFLDRASDTDPRFVEFSEILRKRGFQCLENPDRCRQACNKAVMHYTLIENGINTPYTVIIPSKTSGSGIPKIDTGKLGLPFVIKPAFGGGGEGVIMNATSLNAIYPIRDLYPDQQILLQETIRPVTLQTHPAWFRSIYCLGAVHCCWWNPATHIYRPVTPEEESKLHLDPIRPMIHKIASVCGLSFFSTELALTAENKFVVVDYVNDIIDLRMKSSAPDGVPEDIVHSIVRKIIVWANGIKHGHFDPVCGMIA